MFLRSIAGAIRNRAGRNVIEPYLAESLKARNQCLRDLFYYKKVMMKEKPKKVKTDGKKIATKKAATRTAAPKKAATKKAATKKPTRKKKQKGVDYIEDSVDVGTSTEFAGKVSTGTGDAGAGDASTGDASTGDASTGDAGT